MVTSAYTEPRASSLSPVSQGERVSSIDVLRGVALLGIVIMHVVVSSLPMAANGNPNVAGGKTGANLVAIVLQYVLIDGKMRAIFSVVFGAGSYYFIKRAERRGAGIQAATLYYRRTLWLLVFGLVHAYFIWHGDILYPYALLGLVLFPLHDLSPRALLTSAGVMVVLLTLMSIGAGFETGKLYGEAKKIDVLEKNRQPLSEKQMEEKETWDKIRKYIEPNPQELKQERDMYLGSYKHLFAQRAAIVFKWHSTAFYLQGWDMLTMMLVGIAFAKMNVLSGERSWGFYSKLLVLGWGIGLPIGIASIAFLYRSAFSPLQNGMVWSTYHAGRVFTSLGHLALILMICKAGLFRGLRDRLAAVGQMAFSNYIAHSIFYGLIFFGYGFGLYGKLERYQTYYFVPLLWLFSLIVSPVWMRHFRYGPLEWCWRSLTYWKRQPMRRSVRESAAGGYSCAAC